MAAPLSCFAACAPGLEPFLHAEIAALGLRGRAVGGGVGFNGSRLETMLGETLAPESFVAHACGYDGTIKAALAVLEPRGFTTFRHRRPDGSYDLKYESYG